MAKKKHGAEEPVAGHEGSWAAKVTPPEGELRDAVNAVGPKEETEAGNQYFSKLLSERGPKGLLDTLARFRKMLDEGDGLDLAEMKKHERAAFRGLANPVMHRRHFLGTTAWGLVGASAIGGSSLKVGDHAYQAMTPRAEPPAKEEHGKEAQGHDEGADNRAKSMYEHYVRHVVPYENLIVGAALVNEGIEKWEGIRLRQIKDTVLRMGKIPAETLQAYTKAEMGKAILQQTMGEKHKDWVARDFLNGLLASAGEAGVVAFVQRARKAIDEQSELDLEIDLDPKKWPVERKIFDSIRCDPKRLSGSDFLETWGWVLPGLMCIADGGARSHNNHIKGAPRQQENGLIKAMESYMYDPGQFLLGASLTNEFNLNWTEIKLEQLADAVIEMKGKKIAWESIKPIELDEILENLHEPQEKFAGIHFLRTLLKSKNGVSKVADFLSRANELLDKASAQELQVCFKPEEKKIFKTFKCRPNLLDPENFLHTVGWGVPGAICLMTGSAAAADLVMRAYTGKSETLAGKMKHAIHDYLGPIEGILIGGALVNEALEKFHELKIGQISDATAQLVEATGKQGVSYR